MSNNTNPSNYPGLNDSQCAAFDAYISEGTVTAASKAAKTSRSRVYEWMKTEPWKKAQAEVAAAFRERIGDTVTLATAEALDTLVEVMKTPGAFSHNQVSAANAVIAMYNRLFPLPTPETPGGNPPVKGEFYLPVKGSITFTPEPPAEGGAEE